MGIPNQPLQRLATLYEAAQYAPLDLPTIQAEEAKRIVRQVRPRLWAEAGWWERGVRLFSPSSLTRKR
jgi:hypothetical protein